MPILERDVAAFSYRELLPEEASRRIQQALLNYEDVFEKLCTSAAPNILEYQGVQALYDALLRGVAFRLPPSLDFDLDAASRPELASIIARYIYATGDLFEPRFGDDPGVNGKVIADSAADLGFLLAMSEQYDASVYLSSRVHMMLDALLATVTNSAA